MWRRLLVTTQAWWQGLVHLTRGALIQDRSPRSSPLSAGDLTARLT
jgi:hypothetical protein